jgi:transcriptional regulator with XRE-family HTH domain
VSAAEAFWKDHLHRLGQHIRNQRRFAQMSQRQLARLADLSDTYMSQLERGLHEPSIRVLRSLAQSLGIEPHELIMYAAGLPVDQTEVSTEDAIRRDTRLTAAQRDALLNVLKSYVEANES